MLQKLGRYLKQNVLRPAWNILTSENSNIHEDASRPSGISHETANSLWHKGGSSMPSEIKKNFKIIEDYRNKLPERSQKYLKVNHRINNESQDTRVQRDNKGNAIIPHNTTSNISEFIPYTIADNAFGTKKIKSNPSILKSLQQEAGMHGDYGSLENWATKHISDIYKRHLSSSHPILSPQQNMLNSITAHLKSHKQSSPETYKILKQLITKLHPSVFGLDKKIGFKHSTSTRNWG